MLRAALTLIALSACQVEQPPSGCNLAQYEVLVGQNQSALLGQTLPQDARIIGPDTIVTMDHNPERLNVYVSEDGMIERVACG